MNKQRARSAFWTVVVLSVIVLSTAKNIQWTLAKTEGVRYINYLAETTALSDVACANVCLWTRRCFVANYNSVTMACTLIKDASTFVSDVEWDSFIVVSGIMFLLIYE